MTCHSDMDDSVTSAIQKRKGNFFERHVLLGFVIVKLFPIAIFFLCYNLIENASITILLCFISFLVEIISIKDFFSMELVGLRYSFESAEGEEQRKDVEYLNARDTNNNNGIIHFYSRAAPFLPQANLSNSFWIGYYFSIGVFIFSGIFCFFKKRFALFFLGIIESFIQIVTFSFFVAAHELKRNEENKFIRNSYENEDVVFPLVDENEGKNQNEENETK